MAFYVSQLHQIKLKTQKVVDSDSCNIISNKASAVQCLPSYLWKDRRCVKV